MSALTENQGQPKLAELMAGFLTKQVAAQAAGLAALSTAEVVPFEAVPVQAVDARVAWEESLAALQIYDSKLDRSALPVPPDWPALVAEQDPAMGLAFCAGNFPQAVRDLHPLLQTSDLRDLVPAAVRPSSRPDLSHWAEEVGHNDSFPAIVLAIGVLRWAKQFDGAEAMLDGLAKKAPASWKGPLANERAALAWHRGRVEEAFRAWQGQGEGVPVRFNRGMVALFLGHAKEARADLQAAVAAIPEESSWHHLGQLYLALAEMHG